MAFYLQNGFSAHPFTSVGSGEVMERPMAQESKAMKLWDAFHLPSVATGDHCPVGAILTAAWRAAWVWDGRLSPKKPFGLGKQPMKNWINEPLSFLK